MIYKRDNPTTPCKRFRSSIQNPLGSKIKIKNFYKITQPTVAKHKGTKVCLRRKKTLYKTKHNLNYYTSNHLPGVISQISLSRRYKTFIGLITYSNGLITSTPLFNGAFIGYILKTITYVKSPKIFFISNYKAGFTVPVGYLPITTCIFNVIFNKINVAYFAKAGGTFCILVRYNIDKSVCILKLPSSKLHSVHETSYVTLGRNSNILINNI